MKFIDVSVPLSRDMPTWPGAPEYELKQKKMEYPGGRVKSDSHFSMIPHCGTHIDAPKHYSKDGDSIEKVDIDLLMGPCTVYEHKGTGHISVQDLEEMGVSSGTRILIKTANSKNLSELREFNKDYISLLTESIRYLVDIGVKLLGGDFVSIGPYGELNDENHFIFCEEGGVIIEILDLSKVEPGEYQLIALPIKMVGLEAAPARVLLGKESQDAET